MATRKRPWSTWEKNWLVWLLHAVSTSASPWNSAREAMLCPTDAAHACASRSLTSCSGASNKCRRNPSWSITNPFPSHFQLTFCSRVRKTPQGPGRYLAGGWQVKRSRTSYARWGWQYCRNWVTVCKIA